MMVKKNRSGALSTSEAQNWAQMASQLLKSPCEIFFDAML